VISDTLIGEKILKVKNMLDTFTREFIQSETRLPETDAEAKNVVAVVSCGIFSPNLKSGAPGFDETLFEDTYRPAPAPAVRRYEQLVSKEELQAASGLSYREAKKMDRFSLLAMAACRTALDAAGLSEEDFRNCGIITGNMVGGWSFTEPQLRALHAFGLSAVSPYLASAWFPAAPQGQVTIHLGLKGFAKTITTDRGAGAQAIEMAVERLRNSRRKEFLLAGGVEAPITPFVEAALAQAGVATETVVEGAGYLLLTSMPAAEAAGETKLGEYLTFPLQYRKGFPSVQISNAILTMMERGKNLPFPEAVICNTAACGWIEAETTALLKMMLGDQMPPLLFPTRIVGDSLAASAPIAIGIGYELLRRESKNYRSVLALTLGHQGGHLVWMHR
jgi:hypothetical protein